MKNVTIRLRNGVIEDIRTDLQSEELRVHIFNMDTPATPDEAIERARLEAATTSLRHVK